MATGEFGTLRGMDTFDVHAIRTSAQEILQSALVADFGGAGNEVMVPSTVNTDKVGGIHVRFSQVINGMALEGAGMVVHARADGTVFGINGEFAEVDVLATTPELDADAALTGSFAEASVPRGAIDAAALTYVLGTDGQAHLAWRTTVEYTTNGDPQRDLIYADAKTGKLVARHPQIYYARSLETKDCHNSKRDSRCTIVSTSPNEISTGDGAVDAAHNYAIATYDYYITNHGRDSIDDAGMTLVSRAHWDRRYNNAYWDGTQMTYGDGDGTTFIAFSQDADVVGHELSHGVTERTSGLIYSGESGALNEAISDIFGSMVDRQEGATGADIWYIGEDIYTPTIPGDALRNMADPAQFGDIDFYADRYTGTSDNGGVHTNSGIANLAFQLLTDGGTHPRGKTSNPVPGIGAAAAANVFYDANVNCLTPAATFAEARFCTASALNGTYAVQVNAAWDAVGVPTEYTPPPEPGPAIELTDNVTLTGQDSNASNYQTYFLATVAAGDAVTCTTAGNDGDADLYVRFGADPVADPYSTANDCASYSSTSSETCTTGATDTDATLYALVHAYQAYTNLSITCKSLTPTGPNCTDAPYDLGCACTVDNDCTSNKCKGGPGAKTCK